MRLNNIFSSILDNFIFRLKALFTCFKDGLVKKIVRSKKWLFWFFVVNASRLLKINGIYYDLFLPAIVDTNNEKLTKLQIKDNRTYFSMYPRGMKVQILTIVQIT